MLERHALLVCEDEKVIASVLDGWTVEHAGDPREIEAFFKARTPDDAVFVYADDPNHVLGPVRQCDSTQLLLIARDEITAKPAKGQAFLSPVLPFSLASQLRNHQADANHDGEITARELQRAIEGARMRSKLETPFVIVPRRKPRRPLPRVAWSAAGIALTVISLVCPWLLGGSGLRLALAAGTAWPNRLAALAPVALAIVATLHAARALKPQWVVLFIGVSYGALDAFASRWAWDGLGVGFYLALVAPLPILRAVLIGDGAALVAALGGFITAYALVGPGGSWFSLALGAIILVAGASQLIRTTRR